MDCYIISYDLKNGTSEQYTLLYDVIKSYNGWAHITESTWAVITDTKASEIRNNLARVVGSDDSIFVVKSGRAAAWQNVICRNEWLKNNL